MGLDAMMGDLQLAESGALRFGACLRREWPLDSDVSYLNHGGFGATPSAVLAAQQEWRDRIERNPTAFLGRALADGYRAATITRDGWLVLRR